MINSPLTRSAELDATDPLAGYRERFVPAGDVIAYLDGNSLGRPLINSVERLRTFTEQDWGVRLIRGWDQEWMTAPTTVGDRLGEVCLGAAPGQVMIGDSTSVLLYKLITAAVRHARDRDPGRRVIVVDPADFPTDRFIAEGIAADLDLVVRPLPALDQLDDALGGDVAVVLLSQVNYRSGALVDAATVTARVHDHGALMLWDLSHSTGAVPVELDRWGADLAVGCGYKYLNGGPGAPAFGYVRHELQEQLRSPIWGWMGAADPFAMEATAYAPAPGLRRFISGTPPILALQPMRDMIELIAEVGLPAVRAKSIRLTTYAVELASEHLLPLGATLASPRDPERRGSHVTVDHPDFRAVTPLLWQRGVIPDFRPPDGLRLGLSPLSTGFAEVERGVEAIAELLSRS